MDLMEVKPSRDLYNKVRAGFVAQGSSLTQWCKAQGMNPQNALACLTGLWDGPKAQILRSRLIEASGMATTSSIDSVTHSSSKQPATTGAVEFFYWGC